MLRITALALFALLPLPALAQCAGDSFLDMLSFTDRAELETKATDTLYGTGLYWKASKDDVEMSILGTMHLPDTRHAGLLGNARAELFAADIVLVEATLQDQTDMQVFMAQNPDMMTITNGPTLPDLLDDDTWTAVKDAASARGIPSFLAAKMEPWFLTMTLAIPPCAMGAMVGGDVGLDGMIMTEAATQDIPVQALEPWEDMFALLSDGTFEEQMEMLEMSLVAPDLQDAMVTELINSYFNGETALGWHMTRYSVQFMPNMTLEEFDASMVEVEEALLWNRNRAWIPVIEEAATTHDRIFIGFGAAHLIGEDGVLNLLAQNGWLIEPL